MTDTHAWQEYNEHGNTCHYPGCRLTEEEHARGGIVRSEVTADNPGPLGGCPFSYRDQFTTDRRQ